jgi:nucleotide-binding universal stress UspA family protein
MHPIRTILAATDLSAASDRVLRTAAVLARQSGARLYVLHAVEPLAAMPVTAFGAAGTGMEALVVQHEWLNARATLDAQLARVFGDAHPHDPVFVEGESAPRAICARAEQLRADLIVIGPHADGEGGAPMLGTTADGVLRSAGAPVLVVRGTVPAPLARLLVATDPTEPGTGIVGVALGWAAAFSSRAEGGTPVCVDVVHVILDVVSGTMPFSLSGCGRPRTRALRGERGACRAGVRPRDQPGPPGRGKPRARRHRACARGQHLVRAGTAGALLRSPGSAIALDGGARGSGGRRRCANPLSPTRRHL